MEILLVTEKELKPEYLDLDRLWMNFYKRICLMYALMWKGKALIHYPLVLDIELGEMKYFYFRFGIKYTLKRIMNFNIVLGQRLENKGKVDLDPEEFFIQTLLTDSEDIEDQLNKEMLKHYHDG